MGGLDGSDPFEDLHAYARDLRDAAPDLPPDEVRPVGAGTTRGATYASRTPHLVAAVAVAFLLVAGGAGTGILADGAVPGDALYSLDLLIEDTWASIGVPLDTAAERRAESRVLAERGGFVALPAAPPDRSTVDTENVGSAAAEQLTELGVALAPESVASTSDSVGGGSASSPVAPGPPAAASVVEPDPVVPTPPIEPAGQEAPILTEEPAPLVVLSSPATEPAIQQQPLLEPTTTTSTSSTTTSSTTSTTTTTTTPGTIPVDEVPNETGDTADDGSTTDPGTEAGADGVETTEEDAKDGSDEAPTDQGEAAAAGDKGDAVADDEPLNAAAAFNGADEETTIVTASLSSNRVQAPEAESQRKGDMAAQRKVDAAEKREAEQAAAREAAKVERRKTEERQTATAQRRAEVRRAAPPSKPANDKQKATKQTTKRRRRNRRGDDRENRV